MSAAIPSLFLRSRGKGRRERRKKTKKVFRATTIHRAPPFFKKILASQLSRRFIMNIQVLGKIYFSSAKLRLALCSSTSAGESFQKAIKSKATLSLSILV
jgi:hypothetical protein